MTRMMQWIVLAGVLLLSTPAFMDAQESFLKAYRSIRTYRGTAAFSSWLHRIAYNTFLNDERNRLPEQQLNIAGYSSTINRGENEEREIDVDCALRHLSIRQQAVFDLH